MFCFQVPKVTCQREAPAAHRKVWTDSMETVGNRQHSSEVRQQLASASTGPTPRSPGFAQALMCKVDNACSSTSSPPDCHISTARKDSTERVEMDLTKTPGLKVVQTLAIAAQQCSMTFLHLITPTIDWLFRKVHHSLQGLSSLLCSMGGKAQHRVTLPLRRRPKWYRTAQSGRTGRGSGGKSGNCCPRTMLTHCLRLWCDPKTRTWSCTITDNHSLSLPWCFLFLTAFHPWSSSFPWTFCASPASRRHGVVVYLHSCLLQTFASKSHSYSSFSLDVRNLLVFPNLYIFLYKICPQEIPQSPFTLFENVTRTTFLSSCVFIFPWRVIGKQLFLCFMFSFPHFLFLKT